MIRSFLILAVCGGMICSPAADSAEAGGILDKAKPYVGPLLKVLPYIMDNGKMTGKSQVQTVSLYTQGHEKLVISSTVLQLTIKKTNEKWTGDYHVTLSIPCKVSYAIDLGSAGSLDARWDPGKKQLRVAVPKVHVYSVEALLNGKSYGVERTGWRWSGARVEGELKDAALLEVDAVARRQAANEAPGLQAQAADRLRRILEKKVKQIYSDGKVIVE
jgi:Protein of unknown function (DUF4230)